MIKNEGRSRPLSVHQTQREAIEVARQLAHDEKGDLAIHRRDGRIREWDSYRTEPLPPNTPRAVLFPKLKSKAREREIEKAVEKVIKESHGVATNG